MKASRPVVLLFVCLGLVCLCACTPKERWGQAQIEGLQWNWSGFEAQLIISGERIGPSVAVLPNGEFLLPLNASLETEGLHVVEVSNGRYRLRAALSDEPLVVSTQSTARLALQAQYSAGPIATEGQQTLHTLQSLHTPQIHQADADLLELVTNAVHSVFYAQRDSLSELSSTPALLDRYVDTWHLAKMLAQDEKHLVGFQVRFHDALLASHEAINGLAKTQLDALKRERQWMLRLDSNGKPLRWQHLEYSQQPWACLDYFEKGARWSKEMRAARWSLGVRLWAVSADYSAPVSLDAALSRTHALKSSRLCASEHWRLPSQIELLTLTNPETSQWDFPNSLPFNTLGVYWTQDAKGNIQAFDLSKNALVNDQDKAASQVAMALPISFMADAPPPQKQRKTTQVDLKTLREVYSSDVSQWPAPHVDAGVIWQELGPLPAVEFPEDNPYSEAKVALGRTLFFDTRLSKNENIACASCHLPEQQWTDLRRLSKGTTDENGKRNAMSILNTAYNTSLFWDGRVITLEEQSIHPIQDRLEMALTLEELMNKIRSDATYNDLFAAAYGNAEVTLDGYKQAIATFERTLISQPAQFDRFVAGDKTAMSDQEIWGLHLYRTKARCMNCHSGPVLTDFTFRNTGLTYYGRGLEDPARFNQSFKQKEMGAFRVPSLRDITFTAPYMHNGVFPILAKARKNGSVVGVLAMYNFGMTKGRNANYPQYEHKYDPFFPVIDDLIEPLGMSGEELMALNAFLAAVSAPPRSESAPLEVLKNPTVEF